MRNTIIFFFLLLLTNNSFSKEICLEYENKIEEDFQWKETDFTKKRATEAVDVLQNAVAGKRQLSWYEFPNLAVSINGYLLKENVLTKNDDYSISSFCTFLTSTPIVD